MDRSVFFATPGRGGWVSMEFFASATQTDRLMVINGIMPFWGVLGGNIYVDGARNVLATDCLNHSQKPDLFFLDDDVGFQPEKVLYFLNRPEDVICGAPPLKVDLPPDDMKRMRFPISFRPPDDGSRRLIHEDGLLGINMGPTGFMRIKHHVLVKMAEALPWYHPSGGGETKLVEFFKAGPYLDDPSDDPRYVGRFHTEDTYFVKRWIAMGGSAWVDPDCYFTHRGEKNWSGRFADDLKRRADAASAAQMAVSDPMAAAAE